MQNKEIIKLYHGSKSGIEGQIRPISREQCDFGRGFYMGTEEMQPMTLVCGFPKAKFYNVELDLTGLCRLDFNVNLEWAMFIAYNRGEMDQYKDSAIYKKYKNLSHGIDLATGCIADDRLYVVLEKFFRGEITDIALIKSLSALKLGNQYVALTQKACDNVTIIDEYSFSTNEKNRLIELAESNRIEGSKLADEISKNFRRVGKYFDEIIEEGYAND